MAYERPEGPLLHCSDTYLLDQVPDLDRLVGQEWDVVVDVADPAKVEPRYLHAVVSSWLDADTQQAGEDGEHGSRPVWEPELSAPAEHAAPQKCYSIGPLWRRPDGRSGFSLRLLGGAIRPVAAQQPVRLGSQAATIEWQISSVFGTLRVVDLLDLPPVSSVLVRFETPMTRRRGDIYHPAPSEVSILTSWERAATALGLPGTVDWAAAPAHIVHLNGHTATWPAPKARSRKRDPIGFVGDVAIAVPPEHGRRLHQLARIAAYAGTGAHTTFGMGFTTLMAIEEAGS